MAKSKEQKKKEALERAKERVKISAAQKLDQLDFKYGKGKGAQKERKRLQKLIDNAGDLRDMIEDAILKDSKSGKKKFKVKKGQDPLKEKKKARRAAKRNK